MAKHHDNATYLTANIMFDHAINEDPIAKPLKPIRGQWYEWGLA